MAFKSMYCSYRGPKLGSSRKDPVPRTHDEGKRLTTTRYDALFRPPRALHSCVHITHTQLKIKVNL